MQDNCSCPRALTTDTMLSVGMGFNVNGLIFNGMESIEDVVDLYRFPHTPRAGLPDYLTGTVV